METDVSPQPVNRLWTHCNCCCCINVAVQLLFSLTGVAGSDVPRGTISLCTEKEKLCLSKNNSGTEAKLDGVNV